MGARGGTHLLARDEVPVQLGRDEGDAVEELLDHGVLALRVLLRDLGLLDLRLLVDGDLCALRVAGVLWAER